MSKPIDNTDYSVAHDALGNHIIIGATYGYILKNDHECRAIRGIAEKARFSSVTLGSNESRNIKDLGSKFKKETRRRGVSSQYLFPIEKF